MEVLLKRSERVLLVHGLLVQFITCLKGTARMYTSKPWTNPEGHFPSIETKGYLVFVETVGPPLMATPDVDWIV